MTVYRVKDDVARIPLGRQGENLARRIHFNLSAWQMAFGEGRPALIHKRAGDSIAYPIQLTIDGPSAYWDVTRVDTENPGNGKCELSYFVNDVIAKSAVYRTEVQASMNEEVGFEPQDVPNWVDNVNAVIAKAAVATETANSAAQAAKEAAEEANKAAENAGSSNGDGDNSSDFNISDYVASDEEVTKMLDEIFGEGPSSNNS